MEEGTTGKYLRWLCLLAVISREIYFITNGSTLLNNQEGDMAGIFVCDNNSYDSNGMMIQCEGIDDDVTCGADSSCVQSSCGRPIFPHVGVSFAGSSNPFDPDAATSTQSFTTMVSVVYSLVPYVLGIYFVTVFLALGNVIPLTRLGLMMFVQVVNDIILKNILKEPRPMGSCSYFHSYGLPR